MHGVITEPPRIAVAFLSHDRVHAGWASDYGNLIGHFVGSGGMVPETGERFSLGLTWCQTSMLAEGRFKVAEDAKRKGATKILWIDTDMRFPKQALNMLLRHNEPIVGVNYVSRRPPFRFTAATLEETHLETRPGDTGLVEVAHVGFGFLLTDISVFEGDGPWFTFDWHRDENGDWKQIGEDVSFCREARLNGHKVYVDQELSCSIGHIGEYEFNAGVMQEMEAIPA